MHRNIFTWRTGGSPCNAIAGSVLYIYMYMYLRMPSVFSFLEKGGGWFPTTVLDRPSYGACVQYISDATYNPNDRLNASLKVLRYIHLLQVVPLFSS